MAIHDKESEQFCACCGISIGVFECEARDFLTCSARPCMKIEREHHQAVADGAQEFATTERLDRFGGRL